MFKLLVICCLLSCSLWAYPVLQKMEELYSYVADADDQTLVVFDIDYTLTMPSKPAFHMALFKQYRSSIKEWTKDLSEKEKFWLAPYIVVKGHSKLIEPETPLLLASLQARGIKVLALTACPSALIPGVGNLAEWREREFQKMEMNFGKSFAGVDPFMMAHFKEHHGCYPGFYRGILFCNFTPFLKTSGLADKGIVLRQFLEHLQWKPKHIIMVDDDSQNLDHIAQVMQKWEVDYTGLHYIGAENVAVPHLSEETMHQAWIQMIQHIKADKS